MLTHAERVRLLRHAAGALAASSEASCRWLGENLMLALQSGRSLDELVGIRPPQGSRNTPARLIKREAMDRDMKTLVAACGGIVVASAVLRGMRPAPAGNEALVARLLAAGIGTSPGAVSKAIRRLSSHN